MDNPERLTIPASGLKLQADVVGPPDGPLVLFLHGSGQTRQSWGRALSRAIESVLGDTQPHGRNRADFDDLAEKLLARGRADGTIRSDATAADLYMIVGGVVTVSRERIGSWKRFIELALDGLRPPR